MSNLLLKERGAVHFKTMFSLLLFELINVFCSHVFNSYKTQTLHYSYTSQDIGLGNAMNLCM